jgi:hypothetical protein
MPGECLREFERQVENALEWVEDQTTDLGRNITNLFGNMFIGGYRAKPISRCSACGHYTDLCRCDSSKS